MIVAGQRPDPAASSRREAAIQVASCVLAEKGLTGLTVRSVADALRASTQAVYTLFGGKPGLIDALYREAFLGLAARLDAVPVSSSPPERVVAIADAYRGYAIDNPHLYGIMFGDTGAGVARSAQARDVALSTLERLRSCIAAINGDYPNALVVEAADAIWSIAHGGITLASAGVLTEERAIAAQRRAVMDVLQSIVGAHEQRDQKGQSTSQ